MKKFHILLFSSLLTLHCSLKAQQNIYVDASNNTGIEDGTMAHPFNTILEGLQLSQNSDSICIIPGTYTEDTLLIEKCVSVAGESPATTVVEGTFILSSRLDTLPVLISNLWCRNIMHSDSGYTQTPLTIMECAMQVLNDYTPSVRETGRILVKNCLATDSIHLFSASCHAEREILNCETGGGLWVSITSSHGIIRLEGNHVDGNLKVSTVSKNDTVFITGNTITDSLVVLSVASDPDIISGNKIGSGVRLKAVAHGGFRFTGNEIQSGSLSARYTALAESVMENNTFLNGGIDFKASSGHIILKGNDISTNGTDCGIRLRTVAGGELYDNTVTLPYLPPTGQPFETDTNAICGIVINASSFGGMAGNQIQGGTYGVYLSAISSNDFDRNEIEDSHYGVYLQSVSGYVDSNRVEYCIGDGMILDYHPEYEDTNSIRLNYNIVRNNGGHGIRTRGNCPMGRLDDPGTGYNIIKDNGGYDLYVETPSSFVDTIWAQNNEWTHVTAEEVGEFDIYDAIDDTTRAPVMFRPLCPSGVGDFEVSEIVLYPNPASDVIIVRSAALIQQSAILSICDLSGSILIKRQLHSGGKVIKLDVSSLQNGLYFVQLKIKNQSVTKKLIIRK